MVRSLVGTVNWQAHPKNNHKVDVFICGMVPWEILTWQWREKKFLWQSMNQAQSCWLLGVFGKAPYVCHAHGSSLSLIVGHNLCALRAPLYHGKYL